MYRKTALLFAVVLLAAPAAPALAAVPAQSGSIEAATPPGATAPPSFEVTAPQRTLQPGRTQPLTLQVRNDAESPDERAKNATSVEVEFIGVSTIEPASSGTQFVGRVVDGRPATVTTRVDVASNAAPGVYDVPVAIEYEFRKDSGERVRRRKVVDVTVEVERTAQFEVRDVDADVRVGGQGTVSLEVKNTGSAEAESASLTLQSSTSSVVFGRSPSASRFVGDWEAGETRTLTFDVTATEGAETRSYPLQATVNYETEDGAPGQSAPLRVGITPRAEQTFALGDVRADLEVGERGTIRGTVKNTGDETVEDAVVLLQGGSAGVQPLSPEYAVGTLEPGESVNFEMEATVTPGGVAGPRQFTFRVQYRNDDGSTRASDPMDARVEIAPEQTFDVENVSSDLRIGDRGTIRGTVVNTGNRTVEDAVVVVSGSTPSLTPLEPQYALGELRPGERANFELATSVGRGASTGPRQVTVRVQYDGRDGTPRASDPKDLRVAVEAEQSFAVRGVESSLRVGERGNVSGRIVNTGDRKVQDVVVTYQPAGSLLTPLETGHAVGNLSPGESATFDVESQVAPRASAGPRQLDLTVQYRTADGDRASADPKNVRVAVAPAQEFDVRDVESTLRVGEQGTITGEVVNTADRPVEDVVVVFQTSSPMLTPLEPEYAVGRLEAGESATFELEAQVSPKAGVGPRQVNFRVQYRSDGDRYVGDRLSAPVQVEAEQSFAVENVESTLRVGNEGTVSGTVVNTGNRTLDNVVVAFKSSSPTLNPTEPEYAVGTLEPGQRVSFEFDVEVSESADGGPRQVTFVARYRSKEGEPRSSDPLDARIDVGGNRGTFDVEVVEGSVEVGGSGTLNVTVTNNGSEPVTDVSAKLFPSSPVASGDDEAFVERLEPGASETLTFEVSLGGGAIANKTYPVKMDFQYDDADGQSRISNTYQVPLRATASSGGGGGGLLPVAIVAVLLLAAIGVGVYVRRS